MIFKLSQEITLLLTIIMLICVASSYNYEDKKLEDTHYCKMVEEGTWPAFKEIDGVYCLAEE